MRPAFPPRPPRTGIWISKRPLPPRLPRRRPAPHRPRDRKAVLRPRLPRPPRPGPHPLRRPQRPLPDESCDLIVSFRSSNTSLRLPPPRRMSDSSNPAASCTTSCPTIALSTKAITESSGGPSNRAGRGLAQDPPKTHPLHETLNIVNRRRPPRAEAPPDHRNHSLGRKIPRPLLRRADHRSNRSTSAHSSPPSSSPGLKSPSSKPSPPATSTTHHPHRPKNPHPQN